MTTSLLEKGDFKNVGFPPLSQRTLRVGISENYAETSDPTLSPFCGRERKREPAGDS